MKVVKFGGSSLASATQLEKVLNIVKSDSDRKFVVVSAPGKREESDTKVTDALIKYYRAYVEEGDVTPHQEWIINRYAQMIEELELKPVVLEKITKSILNLATLPIEDNLFLYDSFLAAGENNNAKLVAAFFNKNGLNARYIHPRDAGIFVSSEPGNARILPSSYDKIEELTNFEEVLVIPGFFGVTKDNQICTFSRGGSDVTGALVAASINAELYENWTDVSGFLMADPRIVKNPMQIRKITYRELRELSYMGASVLHEESVFPVRDAGIPINIKNTNNPSDPGTLIVKDMDPDFNNPVKGIAGKKDFTVISIEKAMMNSELGFCRKVLSVLEQNNISFENMPSGIDTVCVVISDAQLKNKTDILVDEIKRTCTPDSIVVHPNMALIATVGNGMSSNKGVAAKIFTSLSESNINIRMIDQGSSEINILIGIENDDFEKGINAIYNAFI